MKRIFSMLCAVAICLGMAGCGANGLPKSVYNDGVKALEVFDNYWDLEITKEEAIEKLGNLESRKWSIDTDSELVKVKSENVYLIIGNIEYDLLKDSDTSALSDRNELAEKLGKRAKK